MAEVAAMRRKREYKEAQLEAERHERVKESLQALREQEQREAEAEEAAEQSRARRRAALQKEEADEFGLTRPSRKPKRSTEKSKLTPGMSWHLWIVLLACVVMVPLIIHKIIDRRAAMRGSHADDASWYDSTVEVE